MKVKALRLGYFNNRRMDEDEIFEISDLKEFSHRWMEAVDFEAPPSDKPLIPFLGQGLPTVKENHKAAEPLSKVAKPTGEQSVI